MKISELFEGTCPAGLPLEESPIRTERVLDLVRAGVRAKKQRPRRLDRTLRMALIAAVLALALSVTAYAIYMAHVGDYVIGQPLEPQMPAAETAEADAADGTQAEARQRLSLVGYQGTPEYQAFTQWEAWKNQWMQENGDRWQEMGVDDSYHETADNYVLYDAHFQDQADKLNEIAAGYGLALHSQWAWFKDTEELYGVLGVDGFGFDSGSGYVYDDGSFKLECATLPGLEGVEADVFVSAKGSFSMISSSIGAGYQEWDYETEDGAALDLALDQEKGVILWETEGAYIYADIVPGIGSGDEGEAQPVTREALEAAAEGIRFDAMAQRFDGRPDSAIAAGVQALAEKRAKETQAESEVQEQTQAQTEDTMESLGRYAPSLLPAQFADMLHAGESAADDLLGLDGTAQYAGGVFFPSAEEVDGFTYYRIEDSSTAPEEYLDAIRVWLTEKFPDGEITDGTVQGCDAVMALMPDHGAVYWYDGDADLIFTVSIDSFSAGAEVDPAAVLALAESVEKIG